MSDAPAKRIIGKPFAKGDARIAPGGISNATRALRRATQEALTAMLEVEEVGEDGVTTKINLLATALVEGVRNGDSVCIKLCCEYVLGKPDQHVTLGGGEGDQLGIRVEFVKPDGDK